MTETNILNIFSPSAKRRGELNIGDFSTEEKLYIISILDTEPEFSDADREYIYSIMFD